jgi:hypothetical protein
MDVRVTRLPAEYGGKRWASVCLLRSRRFIPSFEDLHRIIQAISLCEDEKYPGGQGRGMVARFLWACVSEPDYKKLQDRFKIPARCGAPKKDSAA